MFFQYYWFHLLGLLPARGRLPRYLRAVLGYYDCKDSLIAWHRAELEKLDSNFSLQQAGLRLVAAREKALAEGIGPDDPRYPDIFDVHALPGGFGIRATRRPETVQDVEKIARELIK